MGHWHMTVIFEQMGPLEGPSNIEFNAPPAPWDVIDHMHTIEVPAGTFTIPAPPRGANLYRVLATMVWHNAADVVTPIAGFAELGILQVYDD